MSSGPVDLSAGTDVLLAVNARPAPCSAPPRRRWTEAEFSRYAMPQLENYVLNGRVPRAQAN
ncbi:hypothetical protein [Catenulispora rubra]|uniref:hypothetical protein n=1 Tax=Catenulispora rubra TaxID=280293 RepID=UPI00189264E7|nr:hypothetical protein [Catenulispora rubra]